MSEYSGNIFNKLKTTRDDAIEYLDTVWDDLRVPVNAAGPGPTKAPDFAQFRDNGAGSEGVFAQWFKASSEEQLFFNVQIPHKYKLGTDLCAHLHWTPSSDGGSGDVVSWGLEYTLANISDVFPTTTIISANDTEQGDLVLLANKHYLTELGNIAGSSIDSVSTMLICRVFRDAAGVLNTDDYNSDAGLLEIDFHYQIDTAGSRTELAK